MAPEKLRINTNSEAEGIIDRVALHAREHYDPPLPYHNWEEHIVPAFNEAMDLCGYCEAHGINPDRIVVGAAILLHDAGYAHKLENTGFETKEDYASHIAEQILGELDFKDESIGAVKECIIATQAGAPCPTIEGKIVRRADLANVGGPYSNFLFNTFKLMEEIRLLTGNAPPFSKWRQMTRRILESYLSEDLSLGSFDVDEDGNCSFIANGQKNIKRLTRDGSDQIVRILGDQAARFASFLPTTNNKP